MLSDSAKRTFSTYFWEGIDNGGNNSQEPQALDGRILSFHGSRIPLYQALSGFWKRRTNSSIRGWIARVHNLSSMVVDVRLCSNFLHECGIHSRLLFVIIKERVRIVDCVFIHKLCYLFYAVHRYRSEKCIVVFKNIVVGNNNITCRAFCKRMQDNFRH